MDSLQGKQGDIVADLLKVTDITVCQVWHHLTQQGNTAYAQTTKTTLWRIKHLLLIWIWNYIHYTRKSNCLFHSITDNHDSYVVLSVLSHSFLQMNVTQWGFDLLLSHPLSSRCQVQWESLCCWMPSNTFQNNDNKLQAFL